MNKEAIAENLREHTLKVTPQRLKIVESLNTYGHLNIDMLYREVKESHPKVSLATVYKNLAIMTQNGLLEEVKIPGQKSVYEVKKAPHLHLHCSCCGKIEDIEIDLSTVTVDAQKRSGYAISAAEAVIVGTCPDCQ